jgi:large subunit ribosomal protein L24
MKLLKGDKVIVISGKDKGKTGAIQKVDPKTNRVVVEGVNLRKKTQKTNSTKSRRKYR